MDGDKSQSGVKYECLMMITSLNVLREVSSVRYSVVEDVPKAFVTPSISSGELADPGHTIVFQSVL